MTNDGLGRKKKKSRMYEANGKRTPTWNPFVGCLHECSYCYSPAIYKRFNKCEKCEEFVPHFHKERLKQKFKAGEVWFVCSMGDFAFAPKNVKKQIIDTIASNPETTFYLQSKNPMLAFYDNDTIIYPDNLVLGTTIETNKVTFVSKAPYPIFRKDGMLAIEHWRMYVTIEPIMGFDRIPLVALIEEIEPEFVYIGYDNHNNRLTEPSMEDTLKLIEQLEKITEVRQKSIRKAWWER